MLVRAVVLGCYSRVRLVFEGGLEGGCAVDWERVLWFRERIVSRCVRETRRGALDLVNLSSVMRD